MMRRRDHGKDQAALGADLKEQGQQPGLNAAAMRENADLQRTGMEQSGSNQRAAAGNALGRDHLALEGQKFGLDAQAKGFALRKAGQEEQLRAVMSDPNASVTQKMQAQKMLMAFSGKDGLGGIPSGYRARSDGSGLEAIPGGPADVKNSQESVKQGKDTQDIFSIIDQARPLLGTATGSYGGNLVDKAAQTFGVSTPGAQAGGQLKALQGALVAKMPKMSGPQSDKDVLLYREMAGQIGDPTIPAEQRRAAMSTIEELNMKYLPAVSDAAGYQSVASGAYYRTPDGNIRVKP